MIFERIVVLFHGCLFCSFFMFVCFEENNLVYVFSSMTFFADDGVKAWHFAL